MQQIKVAKFGGSSLADAEQFKKVIDIIRKDGSRKYIVPSAPGKTSSTDDKVTDLLYMLYKNREDRYEFECLFDRIRDRFVAIVSGLKMDFDILTPLNDIKTNILNDASIDYTASRGEYLNGLILAEYLDFSFIDPANGICFDAEGELDDKATQFKLATLLDEHPYAVIPGFYGALPSGEIKTFSRGGSDITGSIVARAAGATLYENWTDVSGFMMADPRIVPEAKPIKNISYQELRELSYMGASVLHTDSVFPVSDAGIPIQVLNTNHPNDIGTLIVKHVVQDEDRPASISGVAGRRGYTVIHIEKDKLNSIVGFGRRVLEIVEQHEISFEHLPTGIDTISIVVSDSEIDGKLIQLLADLQSILEPDVIDVHTNLALVATVGHGMIRQVGVSARLFAALARDNINIRLINQGSSEINIIVGIDSEEYENAIRAIYAEFAHDS